VPSEEAGNGKKHTVAYSGKEFGSGVGDCITTASACTLCTERQCMADHNVR
jgi:hypothetical protein